MSRSAGTESVGNRGTSERAFDRPPGRGWWIALLACGVIVPWWCLTVAGMKVNPTAAWPPAPMPFGWNRVIVVHVLAAVPLGWLLGSFLPRDWRPDSRSDGGKGRPTFTLGVGFLVAVGILLPILSILLTVVPALLVHDTEFWGHLAARSVWCICLTLPWCMAARLMHSPTTTDALSRKARLTAVLMASTVSVAIPGIYGANLMIAQTREFERLSAEERDLRAYHVVRRLADFGSSRRIRMNAGRIEHYTGRSSATRAYFETRYGRTFDPATLARSIARTPLSAEEVLELLVVELRESERRMNEPLPLDATPDQRFDRAVLLANHDAFQPAKEVLGELPDTDPSAAVLLARILQSEQEPAQSSHWFRRALSMLENSPIDDDTRAELFCTASFALADNQVRMRNYRDAERILRDGLTRAESMPGNAEARFHFRLGRHYQMGGRPLEATRHLEIAAADPSLTEPAEALLHTIRGETPLCVMRPGG